MSFEEDFPSLKENNSDYILKEDIQMHCLDKQKAKEIIDKYMFYFRYKSFHEKLKKELGLG